MYPNADYAFDPDVSSIASFPGGLKEEYRFLPNDMQSMRKVNSSGDISRFYRYFNLIQSHRGKSFKWRHYLTVLFNDIRNFNNPVIPKQSTSTLNPCSTSEATTSFATARACVTPLSTPKSHKVSRNFSFRSVTDRSATPSSNSALSLNVGTHVLKICNETKNIARDIYKKVECIQKMNKVCTPPKRLAKQKKHHVKTVEGFGDTPRPRIKAFKKGESSDTDIDVCMSSSSTSRPQSGAGDRRKHFVFKSHRHN